MDLSQVDSNVGQFNWEDPILPIADTSCPSTGLMLGFSAKDPPTFTLANVPKTLPPANPACAAIEASPSLVQTLQSSPVTEAHSSSILDTDVATPPPLHDVPPSPTPKIDAPPSLPAPSTPKNDPA